LELRADRHARIVDGCARLRLVEAPRSFAAITR
jgi:hypothetical protein